MLFKLKSNYNCVMIESLVYIPTVYTFFFTYKIILLVFYSFLFFFFFFNDPATTEIYTLSLHDALPILNHVSGRRELTWELGTLLPGQSRVVDYQLTAASAGRFRNKAIVTAAGGVRDEFEHEVQVAEAKIDLTMTGPATGIVNAAAAYQITVSNAGTSPLTNVVITDPVPAQMAYVSASAGGVLMRAQAPTVGPDVVQWAIGTLEPGASRM